MISVDLSITLTTAERNAWQTLRPKLKSHMAKILHIYRRATPAQRLILREHCNVLDNILDAIGE